MLRIISNDGFFLRDDISYDTATEIALDVTPSQGFYRPRWDGAQWVEGMTQAEIDALKNQSEPAPSLEERVGAVEVKTATIEETLDVLFGGTV
jgi:hypothetical protein